MSTIYNNVQNFIPTEGGTVTIGSSDADNVVILNPATPLTAITIAMPSNPHGGQMVTIASSNTVGAATLTGGSTTLPIVALQAPGYLSFIYDPVNTCWMETALNGIPTGSAWNTQAYVNGVKYTAVFPYFASAVVASGIATFYLTDNGLSSGNSVFKNNIFTQSINLITSSTNTQYQYGGFTVAGGNKSIAITVSQLGLSLGILNFTSAANGITVYLQISGN